MPSDRLVPQTHSPGIPEIRDQGGLRAPISDQDDARPIDWRRYFSAVRRFKWLVLLVTLLGSGAGFALTRVLQPLYEVDATIWISTETQQGRSSGPIRSSGLLNNLSWPELVKSYTILDNVARTQGLYLVPGRAADAPLFSGFGLAERFRVGTFRLEIDPSGTRYTLKTAAGVFADTGTTSGPIGAALGFRWTPPVSEVTPGRSADFSVRNPRDAAVELRGQLGIDLRQSSNLMQLSLAGTDPDRIAATMNAVLDEFVSVAAELKKRNLVEFSEILGTQLAYAEREMSEAEEALENFRVATITLPSEGSPVVGGLELTRDPVFANYFTQKIDADNVRRDREMLAGMLAEIQRGALDVSALLAAPATREAEGLVSALREYTGKETQLRAARVTYTDMHPTVRDLKTALDTLRSYTIPKEAQALIVRLQRREDDLATRIAASSRELRNIPVRSIEEMRLRRNVEVRTNLYTMLKSRFEEARLANASSAPDISILDRALAPLTPTRDTAPRILLMAILGSFAAAIALVILLDQLDSRFRYPEQATGELGLSVIGAVPSASRPPRGTSTTEHGAQLIEAFRTIRLNLQHLCGETHGEPVTVTVASPGAGDGKSLVCANLALSFAQAGCRTLLIDGDVRRGAMHSTFGVSQRPGLVEYLADEAVLSDVLRESSHPRLTLLTCGSRRHRAPELLTSAALPKLMRMIRNQFDAVVVDSAPLGAGVDSFILGTVTGNMIVVLRSGETDRRLAQAKLELVSRLPIRVVGAVLNDVPATGAYQYYAYLSGYASEDGEVAAPV